MSEWSRFKSELTSTVKTRKVSKKLGGSFLSLLSSIFSAIFSWFSAFFWAIFNALNRVFPLPGVK